MRDALIDLLQAVLGFVLIIGIVIVMVKCSNEQEIKEWNNGYCACGGHWRYEQAVGHQMRTSYIYKCDKCGKLIEVWSVQTEVEEVEE